MEVLKDHMTLQMIETNTKTHALFELIKESYAEIVTISSHHNPREAGKNSEIDFLPHYIFNEREFIKTIRRTGNNDEIPEDTTLEHLSERSMNFAEETDHEKKN